LRISARFTEKECGLGAAQLFVLRQLEGEEAVSVNELAGRTLTHQSSVSAIVGKLVELVEQRLVSRRVSAKDSRRAELSLTELGKKRLKSAPRAVVQEQLVDALRRMPASRRNMLAELLHELVREAGYGRGRPPLLFEDHKK
jgi:DNA-binding MarR family transcriptional regulator